MSLENEFPATTAAAREKIQQTLASARDCTNDVLGRGEQYVRERPRTALLSAFALGLAVGVVVAGSLARPPAPRREPRGITWDDSKERLAELFGTVASNLREPLSKTVTSVSDGASSLGESLSEALEKVCPRKFRWW